MTDADRAEVREILRETLIQGRSERIDFDKNQTERLRNVLRDEAKLRDIVKDELAESIAQLNWGILIQRCLQEAVEVAYEQGKKAGQQNGGGHG